MKTYSMTENCSLMTASFDPVGRYRSVRAILFVVFCILGAVGCDSETQGEDGAMFTHHFIHIYFVPRGDRDELTVSDWLIDRESGGKMLFFDLPCRAVSKDDRVGSEFLTYATKYNDLSYDRRTVPFLYQSYSEALVDITVSSDRAFDAQHPAGTPLDDVIRFRAASYRDYIRQLYPKDQSRKTEIDKPLTEVTADDLTLLEIPYNRVFRCSGDSRETWEVFSSFALEFTAQPAGEPVHRLTFTVTTETGKRYTATREVRFDLKEPLAVDEL